MNDLLPPVATHRRYLRNYCIVPAAFAGTVKVRFQGYYLDERKVRIGHRD
jgi:hypothetical protein